MDGTSQHDWDSCITKFLVWVYSSYHLILVKLENNYLPHLDLLWFCEISVPLCLLNHSWVIVDSSNWWSGVFHSSYLFFQRRARLHEGVHKSDSLLITYLFVFFWKHLEMQSMIYSATWTHNQRRRDINWNPKGKVVTRNFWCIWPDCCVDDIVWWCNQFWSPPHFSEKV